MSNEERPLYLRFSSLLLVFIGGTLGTAGREAFSLLFPPIDGVPVAIFGVNIAGAFLLGVLLDGLARGGPDQGKRRALRLFLGTGFLGGFTTYSALATDTALLFGQSPATGFGYGLGTVLIGAGATFAGIWSAASLRMPVRQETA